MPTIKEKLEQLAAVSNNLESTQEDRYRASEHRFAMYSLVEGIAYKTGVENLNKIGTDLRRTKQELDLLKEKVKGLEEQYAAAELTVRLLETVEVP